MTTVTGLLEAGASVSKEGRKMTSSGPLEGTVREVLPNGKIKVFIGGGQPFDDADPNGRSVKVGDVVRLEESRDTDGRVCLRVTSIRAPRP